MFTRTLAPPGSTTRRLLLATSLILLFLAAGAEAWAHNVAEGDIGYIQESSGVLFWPFVYLGAKHMVTGYDHLLFLFGVIFFLYRMKDIGLYVTLFAIGHSTTMLFGVLTGISANAYPAHRYKLIANTSEHDFRSRHANFFHMTGGGWKIIVLYRVKDDPPLRK